MDKNTPVNRENLKEVLCGALTAPEVARAINGAVEEATRGLCAQIDRMCGKVDRVGETLDGINRNLRDLNNDLHQSYVHGTLYTLRLPQRVMRTISSPHTQWRGGRWSHS